MTHYHCKFELTFNINTARVETWNISCVLGFGNCLKGLDVLVLPAET